MNIRELSGRLKPVIRAIEEEKGSLPFAALLLRDDAPGRFDLALAAEWLPGNRRDNLEFVAEKLRHSLREDEMLLVSRILLFSIDHPEVQHILDQFPLNPTGVVSGSHTFLPHTFGGIGLQDAVFLRCHRAARVS